MVNIGIIGVGRWGTNCLRTLAALPEAEVRWICARRTETMQAAINAARPAQQPKMTQDCIDLFEDPEVRAVLITTPAETHYELVKAALLADKDVFVEKPFTCSLKEAEELVKLAKDRTRILMVGHIHYFSAAIRKLQEDIRAGKMNSIKSLRCEMLHNELSRKDAGALWDMMPHAFSMFHALTNTEPQRIEAKGNIDAVTVTLKYPDGVIATARGDWNSQKKVTQLEVVGNHRAMFDVYAKDQLQYDGIPQSIPAGLPLQAELQQFLDCVKTRKEPITSGRHALPIMRMLDAAQRSLDQGKPINL